MSGSIIHLNIDAHQEAQELLPWFALGTLNGEETALVEEHLRTCTQCQADLDLQRKMQAVPLPPARLDGQLDSHAAFARLRAQLPAQQPQRKAPALSERLEALRQAAKPWWMPWLVGAQTVALACLCVVVLQKQPGPVTYVALGASVQDQGNLVVMFKPETTEAQLQRILQRTDARMVDGPMVTGAYLLHVNGGARAKVLSSLRADAAVSMAEPLDAGGKQ